MGLPYKKTANFKAKACCPRLPSASVDPEPTFNLEHSRPTADVRVILAELFDDELAALILLVGNWLQPLDILAIDHLGDR